MNHCQRTYGPILSDTFSSDVLHSHLSSPTDTLQTLNEAAQLDDAKIRNNTQSTKNKIKKFGNDKGLVPAVSFSRFQLYYISINRVREQNFS